MILAGGFWAPALAAGPDVPRVILVGDSTMAPRNGYGDALCRMLGPGVECINLARNGRSSRSFRADGSWARVTGLLGDPAVNRRTRVLVQFGHNDQPGKPGRSTDLESEFPANIAGYVDELLRAGASPVLVTPLTRRTFRGGELVEDLAPWAEAVRRVASEKHVALVDLYAESRAAVARMGPAEADTLAMESAKDFDHTHLGPKGAEFFARMVANDLAAIRDAPVVAEPRIPAACVELRAGPAAVAGDDTARIQSAIDACPALQAVRLAPGGGGGAFLSGPLVLKPGVTLWIDAGATLWAGTDPRDYDRGSGTCGTLDRQGGGCRAFITVAGGTGGGIVGDGAIDGRGSEAMAGRDETWWQLARRAQREGLHQNVPRLVEVEGARGFTMYRIRLRNSPNFHVVLRGVDGFTAWGIVIDAPADSRNTDGIDPMHSRNVSIVDSFIRTGDDGVAIKAGRDGASENVTIARDHFYAGHGVSIGSETVGGVRHVRVDQVSIEGATSGLRIKSDASRGGLVADVRYSDVCLRHVAKPIDITDRYDPRARGHDRPVYRDIAYDRVRVETDDCAARFVPFPEERPAARPQLTDGQAREYAYAKVLDGWDPLAEPIAAAAPAAPDYVVDALGSTPYRTVQAALDAAIAAAAGARSTRRIAILVKPGTYRELIDVPPSTAPITLYGGGADPQAVRITESPHGTIRSAVARVRNDGFQARNLTFANAYNKEHGDAAGPETVQTQAVAMAVDGADRVQFEGVRFEGFQDTLYLGSPSPARPARVFVHRSYVEGDMDFVFGEATAYFLESEIRTLGDRRVSYTLAPSTHYASRYGFVFERCGFTHDGSVNARAGTFKLARQWFRGQRCTPYAGAYGAPPYDCRLGTSDAPANPSGTISRGPLEAVGKVAILDSRIGPHIDGARPWADWNARGTRQFRPVQLDSDAYWANLVAAGIDPVRELGYAARRSPPEPFLVEYRNH